MPNDMLEIWTQPCSAPFPAHGHVFLQRVVDICCVTLNFEDADELP
jgi:hypothetical protein